MISDQYPNYCNALKICTGYFDSLDIMILFLYPSCIVITRDFCTVSDIKQIESADQLWLDVSLYATITFGISNNRHSTVYTTTVRYFLCSVCSP